MMTNQEAIDELQYAIDLIKQDGKDWIDERDIQILEMAVSALEKQIPRKTVKPASPYFKFACPACGNYPLSGKYCCECGQAVVYKEGEG